MTPSVRHRGERRDQESRQVPLEGFKKLHRSALVAAKQRAGSEDYNDVQSAADRLLEMLPGENDQQELCGTGGNLGGDLPRSRNAK